MISIIGWNPVRCNSGISVRNCAFIDKQDKKRHGPLYDVDPTEQYEIDRSELEPLDHIPPLFNVFSFYTSVNFFMF